MTRAAARRAAFFRRTGAAALIAAILTAIAASTPVKNVLQGWVSDAVIAARAELFGIRPLDSQNVLIVGMDTRTLAAPELSKVPQAMFTPYYATLAKRAFEYGAAGLVMDLLLAYDAKDLTLDGSAPLRRYDDDFLKVLKAERRNGRVVLGRSRTLLPARRFTLIAGKSGLGMVEVPLGSGGVVREVPTVWKDLEGNRNPTLSGRGLALLGRQAPDRVNLTPPAPISTLPIVSMIDLLRCDDPAVLSRLLEGRIIFLGGVLPGQDRLKAPDGMIPRPPENAPVFDPADTDMACTFPRPAIRAQGEPTVPGVFLHAAAVDAVASGWQVQPLGTGPRLGVVFAAVFLSAMIALILRPLSGALAMTVVVGAVFLGAVAALEAGTELPVGWAMVATPVGFLIAYGARIRLLDRSSYQMRREFGRYLSPVLVQQMVETGQLPRLTGEERDVTVLFADLTGFTAASERLESAELMRVLNRYLDVIASVVAERGGYVDKFIGDAVMALFNAPVLMDDHAGQAVAAAHDIENRVRRMSNEDRIGGRYAFRVKVGIATGGATVGNVGARDRVNYTVVGHTVNVAARLESLPGFFKTPIVIGPDAAKAVADRYRLVRLATVQVKGITDGVSVFAPLDRPDEPVLAGRIARYHRALEEFEAGRFAAAAASWADLAGEAWPAAETAGVMQREAERLAANPPEDWAGIVEATVT